MGVAGGRLPRGICGDIRARGGNHRFDLPYPFAAALHRRSSASNSAHGNPANTGTFLTLPPNADSGRSKMDKHFVEIVSATRLSKKDFWEQSPLGLSLLRLAHDFRFLPQIAFSNQRGLPDIFNARILAPDRREFLVFMHDDVWIDDYFLIDRVIQGCEAFDIIGVAGNRRRVASQPAWMFIDKKFNWDEKANLAGSIAHGTQAFGEISFFGAVPAECELLDGVFLAARKSSLCENAILFDPIFDFHFYDLDFCRTARQKGLRLGAWPICLTHQSGGAFGSPGWAQKYVQYLEKWRN